jgi:prefoldin subunit 5
MENQVDNIYVESLKETGALVHIPYGSRAIFKAIEKSITVMRNKIQELKKLKNDVNENIPKENDDTIKVLNGSFDQQIEELKESIAVLEKFQTLENEI